MASHIFAHLATGLAIAATLNGCTAAVTSRPISDRETALLIHLIADADSARGPRKGLLRIEPRPLADAAERTALLHTSRFARVDDAEVRHRVAVILAAGADTGRAIDFTECPGSLTPGVSHAGCPDQPQAVVAFGRLSPAALDSTDVSILVIWSSIRPSGQSMVEYSYELRWTGNGWQTIRRRSLSIAE